jgi:hypothetical protein
VDMSSPEPVQSAFATLSDTVTRLEELLATRKPNQPSFKR